MRRAGEDSDLLPRDIFAEKGMGEYDVLKRCGKFAFFVIEILNKAIAFIIFYSRGGQITLAER